MEVNSTNTTSVTVATNATVTVEKAATSAEIVTSGSAVATVVNKSEGTKVVATQNSTAKLSTDSTVDTYIQKEATSTAVVTDGTNTQEIEESAVVSKDAEFSGETGKETLGDSHVTTVPTAEKEVLSSTLTEDFSVPVGTTLTVDESKSFAITNYGTIVLGDISYAGTITNYGTIEVSTETGIQNAVKIGGFIQMTSDISLAVNGVASNSAVLDITKSKTVLDGGNFTLTAVLNDSDTDQLNKCNFVGVTGPNTENIVTDVTIQNITLVNEVATAADGDYVKHGVNAYYSTATLQNVTIKNFGGYAVVVNGSEVTATNLSTSGSGWGDGVNIGKGANVFDTPAFTLISGVISEGLITADNVDGSLPESSYAVLPEEYKMFWKASNSIAWTNSEELFALATEATIGDTSYATLALAIEAATENDEIYLSRNIEITQAFAISKTVNLNLNGYVIDANETGGVFAITGVGKLNLFGDDSTGSEYEGITYSGGLITGGLNTTHGGAVSVTGANAAFNLSGGTIAGNSVAIGCVGGAVYVANATFNMTGGEIFGNHAPAGSGGVAITGSTNKKFYISGSAVIYDNTTGIKGMANKDGTDGEFNLWYGGKAYASEITSESFQTVS